MIWFINIFCIISGLSLLFLFFNQGKIAISQEVLDLFPTAHDRDIIDIYQKFSNSHFCIDCYQRIHAISSDKLDSFLTEVSKLKKCITNNKIYKTYKAIR